MGTDSGAAVAKSATKAKKPKPPSNPLNLVVVNLDCKENRWVTYKSHCGSMQKVVNKCKTMNPLPLRPYHASINICPSYHSKEMCKGRCSLVEDQKPHMVE